MGYYESAYGGFAPYVPVAERRRRAAREVASLRKKGKRTAPVVISGRAIATTFWGRAWCDNLEAYSDYANRLPRGRTYVRNGSVLDLQIEPGEVSALVMGSHLYRVKISISPIARAQWQALIKECAGRIDSLVELLRGRLSQGVMELITRKGTGLFPGPRELLLGCSCPDSAILCKHVAAALYGVGARLDAEPELLFRLRQVDQLDLITQASTAHTLSRGTASPRRSALAGADLAELFGIELDPGTAQSPTPAPPSLPKPAPAKAPAKAVPKSPPKRPRPPAPRPKIRAEMSRQELLASGIAASLVALWLRADLLLPSGKRGVYKTTAAVRRQLATLLSR